MIFDQKILVLGNETSDTDKQTRFLALKEKTLNHGFVNDSSFVPVDPGYYHTTVVDLSPGDIVHLSDHFDTVLMLDQDKESYSHSKILVTTVRLMHDLEQAGVNVIYKENAVAKNLVYWRNYLKENKSFCFYPFLALVDNAEFTTLCPKNMLPLSKVDSVAEWATNTDYQNIREKMLAGTFIPERCSDCYDRENEGQESTRQYETLEWAEKIGATSVEDFAQISIPLYYEVRPSNKCNIMCRTCDDFHSHLIEREWKTIGILVQSATQHYKNTAFDKIDFKSARRLYVGGGEPTIMPEFYDLLRKCADAGYTDFELNIGTNGMKFSDKLVDLLSHFKHVVLSFSFDGYKKVNDYIRWRSEFDTIVENSRMLRLQGHKIALQTVFSMYSITRMHEVFEFYDQEFPDSGLLVQVGMGLDDTFMPFNHPFPELVVESMRRCQQTKIYFQNGRSIKSMVDLILNYYSNPEYQVNIDSLRKFFKYNDLLDQSRNSQLGDYIPELEEGRKFIID